MFGAAASDKALKNLVDECSHGRDHEAPEIRDRSVVRSSVIALAKYSCSGLFDKIANGRTTTDKGDDTTLVGARTGKTAPRWPRLHHAGYRSKAAKTALSPFI
jgi:hypothetical protein